VRPSYSQLLSKPVLSTSMVLEVGPCGAEEMLGWTRFARRIVCELRVVSSAKTAQHTTDVHEGMIQQWSALVDEWSTLAASSADAGRPFRWQSDVEPAMAEYLLDGLNRSVHSPDVACRCSGEELEAHLPMTKFVLWSFVEALEAEAGSCRHYTDQVRTSLVGVLDD
jgi:hypothetical protein